MRKATTIAVDEQSWLPEFSKPVPSVPEYEYGNENRSVILTIHGCLHPVDIQRFLSETDADLASELTSVGYYFLNPNLGPGGPEPALKPLGRPWGAGLWRGVCIASKPRTIVGWASIEHPDFQSDEEIASSEQVYAFFLLRTEEKGGWFRYGSLLVSRVAFNVLFLKRSNTHIPCSEDCFERIGVGALFGIEVDKVYQSTEKTTISLV